MYILLYSNLFLEDIFLFIRRFSVFIKAQRLSCLYLPLVGVYYQEALHLFFCLSMLILNYSLVYSGIHSFMITRNSSFYSYSTSWIWLSFLFAVWITLQPMIFPKRPCFDLIPSAGQLWNVQVLVLQILVRVLVNFTASLFPHLFLKYSWNWGEGGNNNMTCCVILNILKKRHSGKAA